MSKNNHRQAKKELIQLYGRRCWLCGRNAGQNITYHHIIPKYAGGEPRDKSNGSLLCAKCHQNIHLFKYGTLEYTKYENALKRL